MSESRPIFIAVFRKVGIVKLGNYIRDTRGLPCEIEPIIVYKLTNEKGSLNPDFCNI